MSTNDSLFASGNAREAGVFGASPPPPKLVKEVVRFVPAPNPYEALERAGRRFAEGKGVFGETTIGVQEKLSE